MVEKIVWRQITENVQAVYRLKTWMRHLSGACKNGRLYVTILERCSLLTSFGHNSSRKIIHPYIEPKGRESPLFKMSVPYVITLLFAFYDFILFAR